MSNPFCPFRKMSKMSNVHSRNVQNQFSLCFISTNLSYLSFSTVQLLQCSPRKYSYWQIRAIRLICHFFRPSVLTRKIFILTNSSNLSLSSNLSVHLLQVFKKKFLLTNSSCLSFSSYLSNWSISGWTNLSICLSKLSLNLKRLHKGWTNLSKLWQFVELIYFF